MSVTADTTATAEQFVHLALFYGSADEYLAGTVPFIREGLAAGDPVMVSVPAANGELLRAGLGADAGRVGILDMISVGRNPGRIIPGVLRAFADAYPDGRPRIIGEPIWAGRSRQEYPACVQHEALINAAFAGRRVNILCPYDSKTLEPAVLVDAMTTHPVLVDADGTRSSADYAPDRIVAAHNVPLARPHNVVAFDFDAGGLAQARRIAVEQVTRLGLGGERLEMLVLAVGELTTNSVVHGGGVGTLRLWAEDDHVVCEVRDAGQIGDPLAGRNPVLPDQLGGRGLLLVNHLADLVRTYTGDEGTTTQVRFRL